MFVYLGIFLHNNLFQAAFIKIDSDYRWIYGEIPRTCGIRNLGPDKVDLIDTCVKWYLCVSRKRNIAITAKYLVASVGCKPKRESFVIWCVIDR